MNLLIDSHVLVWLLQELHRIGPGAKDLLNQTEQTYVSLASIWELGLKHSKGQLFVGSEKLLDVCRQSGYKILGINEEHVVNATSLKFDNKDPFDMMLLAQAQSDGLKFITADKALLDLGLDFVVDARK